MASETTTQQATKTLTFEPGETYFCHWVTDHTARTPVTVIRRTAKFVTLQSDDGTVKRCGVTLSDGQEVAYPFGRYSLCPILRAGDREGDR